MAKILSPDEKPCTYEQAQDLINEIRHEAGIVDQIDEIELGKTSQGFASRYRQERERHRSILARYTKT